MTKVYKVMTYNKSNMDFNKEFKELKEMMNDFKKKSAKDPLECIDEAQILNTHIKQLELKLIDDKTVKQKDKEQFKTNLAKLKSVLVLYISNVKAINDIKETVIKK